MIRSEITRREGAGGEGGRGPSPVPCATERPLLRVLIVAVVAAALFAGLFAGGAVADEADASAEANLSVSAELAGPFDGEPYADEDVLFETADSEAVDRYLWSFDDGTATEEGNHRKYHQFDEPGNYTVEVTAVFANGTVATGTVDVSVQPVEGPTVRFGVWETDVLTGEPAVLEHTFTNGAIDEQWIDTGDGTTLRDPESIQRYRYERPGNYTATYTLQTRSGETVTETVNVTVRPEANSSDVEARFEVADDDPQPDEELAFDASSSRGNVSKYWWDWNDGGWSQWNSATKEHSFDSVGAYDVTLTVVGENGTDTTTREIVVGDYEGPKASVTADRANLTVGQVVEFDASASLGNVGEYEWHFGDASRTTSSDTVVHSYESPGEYTVALTIQTRDGGNATTSTNVTVQPADGLSADLALDTERPTTSGAVRYDASDSTGQIEEYHWDFGNGRTDERDAPWGASEFAFYDDPGTYTVELTVVGEGGENDTATRNVSVQTEPYLEAGLSITNPYENGTHVGQVVFADALDSVGSVETYEWQFGDERTIEDGSWNAQHPFTTPGNHTIELTVHGASGKTNTATETVTIEPATLDAAIDPLESKPYVGQPVWLTAYNSTGVIETRSWDLENATTWYTDGTATLVSFDSTGNHSVELSVENGTHTDTATQNVTVAPQNESTAIDAQLEVDATRPTVGETVTFDSSRSEGALELSYWFFDDGEILWGPTETAEHAFDEAGTYNVTYVAAGADAADRAHVEVEVVDDEEDDADGGDDDPTGDIVVPPSPDPGPSGEASVEIASVDAPTSVAPGATFDVTVEIENSGDAGGTATVEADLEDGSGASRERALDADASRQVGLTLTAPESAGDHDLTVATEDDERTLSLTVEGDSSDDSDEEEPSDAADEDGGDDSDDGSDGDGTPGFGLAGALVALAVALLARSRSGA